MKPALWLVILLLFSVTICNAQDESKAPPTNFDEFVAKHTGFIQIEDFQLPRMILELSYGETRIRKVKVDGETRVYYQVESGQYNGSVATDDFPALMKAYAMLKAQSLEEKKNTHDYFVNKYVDRGGLEIGYVVERKKLTWFMKPHRFGARTLFLKDPLTMDESLNQGAARLEQLR